MNFAYDLDTDVDWSALINIMNKFPDRLYSVDGVKSILSCFHFESKVNKQTLLNYYSSVFMKKDASSANILSKLAFLSSRNFITDDDVQNSSRDRKK